MSQFVADFESYMPDEFAGKPYGPAGLLANADDAGIDVSVVFQASLPADPRPGNAAVSGCGRGPVPYSARLPRSTRRWGRTRWRTWNTVCGAARAP